MYDDIYDATLIHQPDKSDVKMDGDLQCPSCDEKVFPGMTDDVLDAAVEEPIAAPFDCPECGLSLEFLIEPLPTEEIGLGITVVRA
jgi:hypothetical protein